MTEEFRVLLVDDNEDFLEVLGMEVEDLGFPTLTAVSVDDAFAKMAETPVDIIVSDLHMEGKSGMDFIFELRGKHNLIPFIFLTGAATKSVAVDALRNGAFDLLEKPIEPEELVRVLRSAGKLVRSIREDAGLSFLQHADDPRIINLRSSARAFDALARDSGITSKPFADYVIDDPSPTQESDAAELLKIKALIDDVLKRNETAIDQLDNGQFSRTSLSFLCRSYNLVRENAEQTQDNLLASACETASSCFSFYRVNPQALNKSTVTLFKKFNEYLRELNQVGSSALKKHQATLTAVQEVERALEEGAA